MVCKGLESGKGLNPRAIQVQAREWLQAAENLGLGVSQINRLDIHEIKL